jgi:hypothetical protein
VVVRKVTDRLWKVQSALENTEILIETNNKLFEIIGLITKATANKVAVSNGTLELISQYTFCRICARNRTDVTRQQECLLVYSRDVTAQAGFTLRNGLPVVINLMCGSCS